MAVDASCGSDQGGLERFVLAQEIDYAVALAEIRSGRKHSHWMWYIFPQIKGLGSSSMAQRYAIQDLQEARAYLNHGVLGPRLLEISEALLGIEGRTADEIFGFPDNMKLKSCATLFARVNSSGSVFEKLLAKYFNGERDAETVRRLS
jgi:uncharacterized protein (DUF1810 family)